MIRLILAFVLALLAAQAVDSLGRRRGLDPPGFRHPVRRGMANALLALLFLVGIFFPALHFDQVPDIDVESISTASIFFFQGLLVIALGLWLALGYLGTGGDAPLPGGIDAWVGEGSGERGKGLGHPAEGEGSARRTGAHDLAQVLGLRCREPFKELIVGTAAGIVAWGAVLMAVTTIAIILHALGGEKLVGSQPPEMIVWMAGLPVAIRLLISLTAGVVEELFFRGFLQMRAGIGLSSVLFILGHLGYGQPFMLVGLTLLSLFYAWLVRWRGNIWAAVTAHTIFDAVQLLVVIPAALRAIESGPDPTFLSALQIW